MSFPSSEALSLLSRLIDQVLLDPAARRSAQERLLRMYSDGELFGTPPQMAASTASKSRVSNWSRGARPGFLYVMYAMILCALPIGLVAAFNPGSARAIADGMNHYLAGLPEPLYALFGTGYLGYATLRQWGKVKGTDR